MAWRCRREHSTPSKKKLPGRASLRSTGQSSRPCRHPAFPLCILPSMGAGHAPCTRPYPVPPSQPFPGLDATVLVDPRQSFRARIPAYVGVTARPARQPVTGSLPVPDLSCLSAPRYGCRQRPPGRFRGGTLHDPRRHPLSIPFDRCCPYPLHPRQILDAKEVAVLSPVRDDRLGLVWPHVRQSLLQRRRICCIDVDPVGCLRSPHQQQSQHQRLTRKPRPHLATPCGSEPVPAGYPVGSSSVPRHIHTAYRPQRLHTASQIPDVV